MIHRILEYSLQDAIAKFLPYLAACTDLLVAAVSIYEVTIRLLLCSALPEVYQTWWTFGLCLVEELRLQLFTAGLMVTTWQIQVVAFEFISNSLQVLIDSVLSK